MNRLRTGRIALLLSILALCTSAFVAAQDLRLAPDDLRITQSLEGGYELWVRKLPDMESVLLTESTRDPDGELAVYAYRNPEYHPLNGDEQRMLNGEFLDSEYARYSLIDSTPEEHPELGQAFRIFIPYVVEYGYPWTRSGEVQVLDGTFLNIRTFPLPYASYEGGFVDNPYRLTVTQAPTEGPPEGNFMDETVDEFTSIADLTDGIVALSPGEDDIAQRIAAAIDENPPGSLELVLVIDTTESMKDDVPFLQSQLIPLLEERLDRFPSIRVGLVYYRDYLEEYLTRTVSFRDSLVFLQAAMNRIRVSGGRDIPEAVYEGLHAGLVGYEWTADNRMIILIGDAPPHPRPRGDITAELVFEEARTRQVKIHTIILPQ